MELHDTKIVYLDQKDWIDLARVKNGLDTDGTRIQVLKSLEEAVARNKLLIPLSFSHFDETLRRQDKNSRVKLASLMASLSKGITMCPHKIIIDAEIRNAILVRLGKNPLDLRSWIFGKGVSHAFGSVGTLVRKEGTSGPDLPEEKHKEILDYMNSPEAIVKVMEMAVATDENTKLYQETVEQMEKNRREIAQRIKDNDLRYRAAIATFLADFLGPMLFKCLNEFGLTIRDILTEETTREDMEAFFRNMPSLYCSFILTNRRDQLLQRPIKPNDINDIGFLSMAIPYCDIVVTESMWASVARQEKLHQEYDTTLLSSVTELDGVI